MDFGTHGSLEPINALQILRDNCTDRLFSVYPSVPFELWTMIAYQLLQNKWMNEYNKKEGMVGERWESSNLNSWLSPNLLGPQFISLHQLFSSSPPSPSLQDLGGSFQALTLQPAFLDFAPRHMTGVSIILISGSGHGSAGHPASQQCPCLHVVSGRGGIPSLEDPLIPGKVLQVKEHPLFKLQKTRAKQNNATQAKTASKVSNASKDSI